MLMLDIVQAVECRQSRILCIRRCMRCIDFFLRFWFVNMKKKVKKRFFWRIKSQVFNFFCEFRQSNDWNKMWDYGTRQTEAWLKLKQLCDSRNPCGLVMRIGFASSEANLYGDERVEWMTGRAGLCRLFKRTELWRAVTRGWTWASKAAEHVQFARANQSVCTFRKTGSNCEREKPGFEWCTFAFGGAHESDDWPCRQTAMKN